MTNRTCPVCGAPIVRRGRSGPLPTYCSGACRAKADYMRSKTDGRHEALKIASRKEPALVACQVCGVGFMAKRVDARLCSNACGNSQRDRNGVTCKADQCDRGVRARGLCVMHWKRLRASEIGHAKQPFDGARMRRHYERRTWQRSGENVTISGLRERDGDNCGICGLVIDFELSGREAMGRTVDHVLPRSKGGAHSWANTQLAHLRCNLSKGAKLPDSIVA